MLPDICLLHSLYLHSDVIRGGKVQNAQKFFSGEVIVNIPEVLLLCVSYVEHILQTLSIKLGKEWSNPNLFSSQRSLRSAGILEIPPCSEADIRTHMQNRRCAYSVRSLHFKNVAPNLLFV